MKMGGTQIEKKRTVELKGSKTVMRSRAGQGRSPGDSSGLLGGRKGMRMRLTWGGPIKSQEGEGRAGELASCELL